MVKARERGPLEPVGSARAAAEFEVSFEFAVLVSEVDVDAEAPLGEVAIVVAEGNGLLAAVCPAVAAPAPRVVAADPAVLDRCAGDEVATGWVGLATTVPHSVRGYPLRPQTKPLRCRTETAAYSTPRAVVVDDTTSHLVSSAGGNSLVGASLGVPKSTITATRLVEVDEVTPEQMVAKEVVARGGRSDEVAPLEIAKRHPCTSPSRGTIVPDPSCAKHHDVLQDPAPLLPL